MSRPLSHVLPIACAAISIGFTACVGTIYDPMYTSHRNIHYKPKAAAKEASADAILEATKPNTPSSGGMPVDSALPPPADIPGLPPAGDAAMPPALPPPGM